MRMTEWLNKECRNVFLFPIDFPVSFVECERTFYEW